MKRSLAITVGGHRYTIKSDAEERYVRGLAEMVDERIRDVQRGAKSASPEASAVLAALQLADELERERGRRVELRRRLRARAGELRGFLEREFKS